ncbi:MAG: hypothetical protein MZV63_43720 [Marinilabiliales bacterium]|nr:hypothetical protein [Marinilabiliales bacterium]
MSSPAPTTRLPSYMDPYASESDKMLMEKGWFDVTMPDLNQSNPLVETYLIQTQPLVDSLQ